MLYDLEKIQNIEKHLSSGQVFTVEGARENTAYLIGVIKELADLRSSFFIQDAAKCAMTGLLSSPQTFGSAQEEGIERVVDLSTRLALALEERLHTIQGNGLPSTTNLQ